MFVDVDQHRFQPRIAQGLSCKNVFDLGCADTKAKRAKRTIGGRMAVSTSHAHIRRNQTLFRTHDMFNTPTPVAQTIKGYIVLDAIGFEIVDQKL